MSDKGILRSKSRKKSGIKTANSGSGNKFMKSRSGVKSRKKSGRKASSKLKGNKQASSSEIEDHSRARMERALLRMEQEELEQDEDNTDPTDEPPPEPDTETLLRIYFDGDSVNSVASDEEEDIVEPESSNENELLSLFNSLIARQPTGPAFTVLLEATHSDFYEMGPVRDRWLDDVAFMEDTILRIRVASPSLVSVMKQYKELLQDLLDQHSEARLDRIKEKRRQNLESMATADSKHGHEDRSVSKRISAKFETLRRMSVSRALQRMSMGRRSRASTSSTQFLPHDSEDEAEEHARDVSEHRRLVQLWLLMMQDLVEIGIDVNTQYVGSTLLDILCSWEPESHHPEVTEMVVWLLDHGAAVEGGEGTGLKTLSPLVNAITRGYALEAEALVSHGANVEATDSDDVSAKELAKSIPGLPGFIKANAANGANRASFSSYFSEG